jgi:hypothetical protein
MSLLKLDETDKIRVSYHSEPPVDRGMEMSIHSTLEMVATPGGVGGFPPTRKEGSYEGGYRFHIL